MKYKTRIADEVLKIKLKSKGVVVIEGPKWCGKTTTATQFARSILRVDDPAKINQNKQMADINPAILLKGETPRLVDEWQIIPKIWNAARYEIDSRGLEGQFIFTGSAVPIDSSEITHSGTGRFTWLTMRTMSLYESLESTGEVSLKNLFSKPIQISGTNKITFDKLAYIVCRGGWPHAIDMKESIALEQAYDYYNATVKSDINRADEVNKNPERVKRLMKSYARNQGTQISNAMLREDIISNDVNSLDEDTIALYINALKKIYVIEDMPAWNPNLRSKTAIRTSDTRYFADPSIAVAALGLEPDDLKNDLKTFGLLFETMCIRDLRIYASSINGEVYHYRDKSNLECDAVIHLRNGSYGLVEIKLGGDKLINEAIINLKMLADKIDDKKMNKPEFLMVLIGIGDYAYKRDDGVYIVPIGCLKN